MCSERVKYDCLRYCIDQEEQKIFRKCKKKVEPPNPRFQTVHLPRSERTLLELQAQDIKMAEIIAKPDVCNNNMLMHSCKLTILRLPVSLVAIIREM